MHGPNGPKGCFPKSETAYMYGHRSSLVFKASSSLYFAKKNIIINNTIETQLAGR